MSSKNWYKLDNTAKLMPSMTNSLNTNVFRLVCTLKNDVDRDILEEALNEALLEFPLFNYTMKNGLFWHYLEKTDIKPKLEEDKNAPCSKIDNGLLFRLTYYKKRINLEVYHVLSDGNGAMEFLKYIVCTYVQKISDIKKDAINKTSVIEKERDDFKKFDNYGFKLKTEKKPKAYKLKLDRKDDFIHDVIEAHIPLSDVKCEAKKYNSTITIYLCAVLIKSIIKNAKVKDLKKPIGIAIPVDLRNTFSSKTSRNFFYTVCVQYKPKENNQIESIIEELKPQFERLSKKEFLQDLIDTFMTFEKFPIIRIVPNIIKDVVLSYISRAAKKGQTVALSNLGLVKLPEYYSEYIDSFSSLMSTEDMQLTVVSYGEKLVLGFTSHFVNKEIERSFIEEIKKTTALDIKIYSNMGGEEDE